MIQLSRTCTKSTMWYSFTAESSRRAFEVLVTILKLTSLQHIESEVSNANGDNGGAPGKEVRHPREISWVNPIVTLATRLQQPMKFSNGSLETFFPFGVGKPKQKSTRRYPLKRHLRDFKGIIING